MGYLTSPIKSLQGRDLFVLVAEENGYQCPTLLFLDGYRAELDDCDGGGHAFQVPMGTLVKEGDEIVADLSNLGDEYMAALGGAGGKGNRFFLANDNRAPVTCTPGQPGQERVLHLELKTMAHAGMVCPPLTMPHPEVAGP